MFEGGFKFSKYRGWQIGGGIGGMFFKKLYMILVNLYLFWKELVD